MQEISIHLDYIAFIILAGIFFGFFNAFFLIKKSIKKKSPNLFMGILLLVLSLIMLEGWLNYTGYIFKILRISNFAEPLNFTIAPLIFLFTTLQFGHKFNKKDYLHFMPFLLWLGYCTFYFLGPDTYKYNGNIEVMQLDIPFVKTDGKYLEDPLGIRNYVNLITILHISSYVTIMTVLLVRKAKSKKENIFNTSNSTLKAIRNSFYHFLAITLILIAVKSTFESDMGDHFIYLYVSYMIFVTTYQIMNASSYFDNTSSFLEGPILKYKKSSLIEENKDAILYAINHQMTTEKFFLKSTASLTGLSKEIRQSSHHVSQVINERLDQTFFGLIAFYRVEEAKTILKSDLGKKLTIEEIAERVGYNSKSAFNTTFKKLTSQTPSSYRDS
jgi:AraC-like DNA-binding protein